MAWTAHKTDDEMREHFENSAELRRKAKELAALIKASKHFVVFTGAGISTAAGIPDFRGPEGVWTLRAQGRSAKAKTSTEKAFPTPAHMSLVALQEAGFLKHLISQNCDGIHRRSGFPKAQLSELHGNGNLEYCKDCGAEFLRDFGCHSRSRNINDHRTGRHCVCGGALHDSIIHFGENLPEKALKDGFRNARAADLVLVLGSSLTVTPACDMPKQAAQGGARLVIANLQKTPLDDLAALRIHARCDDLMAAVMGELGLTIPAWILRRHIRVEFPQPGEVVVSGEDESGTPSSLLAGVRIEVIGGKEAFTAESNREPFHFYGVTAGAQLRVNLDFLGYFNEPPTGFTLDCAKSTRVRLEFDTEKALWSCQQE